MKTHFGRAFLFRKFLIEKFYLLANNIKDYCIFIFTHILFTLIKNEIIYNSLKT